MSWRLCREIRSPLFKRKGKEMTKRMLLLAAFVSLLAGCRTKYVAVPEVHTRDSIVLRLQRDSIFLHDSVYVNTYLKGDTLYIYKEKTTYLYKDRLRIDTVNVAKTDSVSVVVEVEKPLTRWQQMRLNLFWWIVGIAIALLGWTFRKPIAKLFV